MLSFSCVPGGSESDMRFIYCASVISYLLEDWSGIDSERAYQFILASQVCGLPFYSIVFLAHLFASPMMVALAKDHIKSPTVIHSI